MSMNRGLCGLARIGSSRFGRIQQQQQQQTRSTASVTHAPPPKTYSSPEEYEGSKNFVAGKQGYAPGFPPPKGCRDVVRAKPTPMKPTDLPAPSPRQHAVPRNAKAANDAMRQYRQKLRQKRYAYMHESLTAEQDKQVARQESRERAQKVVQERRRKLIKERNEFIEKLRADPLSTENVLNPEGRTVLANLAGEVEKSKAGDAAAEAGEQRKQPPLHTIKVGYKLQPPRVSVSIPREANEERNKEREKNRRLARTQQHENRMQALMALYHESESFVNYENVAQMAHRCVDVMAISQPTLAEMTDSLSANGGTITAAESAHRSIELRNMLQGTAGRQSKAGYDHLVRWTQENGGTKGR
ncbi:hypothetical protein H4S06_005578 [Coemansia sp. BCRC 34490]|nr:hypothetical protein H4S06_005578 [Coemansia sp. BCRC 34490]